MTAVLAILARLWPWILCFGIGAGTGSYLVHTVASARYSLLQATYAKYQAEVAQANEAAQQAAREALQQQIQSRLDAERNNSAVIQKLQAERDTAASDRDFARRLLAAAQAKPATGGHSMPAPGHQSGSAADPASSGDRPLIADLADAAAEARGCFQQYHALLDELQPQLRSP